MLYKFKSCIPIIASIFICSCSYFDSNETEPNVQYIYPKGKIGLEIDTKEDIPKSFQIDNIYSAFAAKSGSNAYKLYIEGESEDYHIWIQGILPMDSSKKLDMNTGFGIFGRNKSNQHIDITYQAFNVSVKDIKEPTELGDPLSFSFNGWFYEKRKEDDLLNIETARKKLINGQYLQFQLIEDIIEAKKQIEE